MKVGPLQLCWWWLLCGLASCNAKSDDAVTSFDRQQLLNPASCQACHPGQYQEWSGSMHAYAADDPVFIAMNARGQEETSGALGSFCVNCHAPMAVRENMTDDGLNLAELGPEYRGVTCYFCHNVESIEGVHNNPLVLANDTTLRGPFEDAIKNSVHASVYSPHFDPRQPEASALCGTCHDVTLPEDLVGSEVRLERTYAEWQDTLFARPYEQGGVGCNGCHMPYSSRRDRGAEVENAPTRRSARHDFEGVDLALDTFPNRQRQELLVESFLASSLLAEICVSEVGVIEITLENAGAGHQWPSGASHDREAWLEIEAFIEDESEPVFRTVAPESTDAEAQRVVLKDRAVDADGEVAHMFWDVAEVESSTTLPGIATRDALDPEFHRERRTWDFDARQGGAEPLARVTLTVRMRPIGLAILEDLVESGHLEVELAQAMPVIDLLPDRCYEPETIEQHADILVAAPGTCDPSAEQHTLVWVASEANEDNRRFRASRVRGVPARCLSHPTYVSVPQTP